MKSGQPTPPSDAGADGAAARDGGAPAIALPVAVRRKVAHAGAHGAAWLAALPGVVTDLERRWSITVGAPLAGGSAAFVAPARAADGTAAVLKIGGLDVDDAMTPQVEAMLAAAGEGYALVLAADLDRHAVLLERLGSSLDELAPPVERQLAILVDTLLAAWRPAPAGARVFDKAGQLTELITRLWAELREPCPERVVAAALACARRRAAAGPATGRAVVVHGDPHPANALSVTAPRAGAASGFVFVDPDGFVGDPAYDLGVVLREWTVELSACPDPAALLGRWRALVAARSGVDADAIRDWAFVERVSSGLYLLAVGDEDLGRAFLTTADRLTTASA